MTDLFNKILGAVLAFILLAGAPLIINTMNRDLTIHRSVLNEMTNFIDKVTDNGRITETDLADFHLGISSYGMAMDATLSRYMKVTNPDGAGGTYTSYVYSDDITTWNTGDILKVQVQAIDYTGAQRIQNRILHLYPAKFDQTLAGMIRK
ncbi:hypothetical protein [Cohnella cellulosilytica]|uniref:Uncharacterized protein n=1 Tax=Cohnella cellulosilytica TaxID=986710 RepID=A0ABW2F4C4_9BACL